MPKIKTIDELVNETLDLQKKINAGIIKENEKRKKEAKDPLPTFNLSKEQVRKNINSKYDYYNNCNQFLNENSQIEKDNKHHIARNGDPSKKENLREPFNLNSENVFKAFEDNEFKDVVKQVNTAAKSRDFKMNLISSHVNADHSKAFEASKFPNTSLDFLRENKKQVYLGADFSNICKKDNSGFNVSDNLGNELDNNKKFFQDPYKAILSQVNFAANPASFLFSDGYNVPKDKAEALKAGINSMSFVDNENTNELFDLKQVAQDVDNINDAKKEEYAQNNLDLIRQNDNPVLGNVKSLINDEKDKFKMDALKDRFDDPKRSMPLNQKEFNLLNKDKFTGENARNKMNEAFASYGFTASMDMIDGDREYDKKMKEDDNRDFIKQAVKDEYELNNRSGASKFFSMFTKPDENSNNTAFLKSKVEQNKNYIENNNLTEEYKNAFSAFNKEKEAQKKQTKEESKASKPEEVQKTPTSRLKEILKTPATKGKSVMETGDPTFNRAYAAETKREMNRIYKKSSFLSRQLSRLIPDFLLDNSIFRFIMGILPFGIGRGLLKAADSRREIQKFNRRMDRGFHENPLGRFNNDPTLSPEQRAVADYKNNYMSILRDYYKTNAAGRFGSNFIPKSWTETGKYKLDIENNDQMLQDILGPLSSSDLKMMKDEVMNQFKNERNQEKQKTQNLNKTNELEEEQLDKNLGIENENQKKINNELENENNLDKENKKEPFKKEEDLKINSNQNKNLDDIEKENKLENNNVINNENNLNNNIINNKENEKSVENNNNINNINNNIIENKENEKLVDNNNNINNINNVENKEVHRTQLFLDDLNEKNSDINFLPEEFRKVKQKSKEKDMDFVNGSINGNDEDYNDVFNQM